MYWNTLVSIVWVVRRTLIWLTQRFDQCALIVLTRMPERWCWMLDRIMLNLHNVCKTKTYCNEKFHRLVFMIYFLKNYQNINVSLDLKRNLNVCSLFSCWPHNEITHGSLVSVHLAWFLYRCIDRRFTQIVYKRGDYKPTPWWFLGIKTYKPYPWG